jgi:hypothetical protein
MAASFDKFGMLEMKTGGVLAGLGRSGDDKDRATEVEKEERGEFHTVAKVEDLRADGQMKEKCHTSCCNRFQIIQGCSTGRIKITRLGLIRLD